MFIFQILKFIFKDKIEKQTPDSLTYLYLKERLVYLANECLINFYRKFRSKINIIISNIMSNNV